MDDGFGVLETFKERYMVACKREVLVKFTVVPNVLLGGTTEDVVLNK